MAIVKGQNIGGKILDALGLDWRGKNVKEIVIRVRCNAIVEVDVLTTENADRDGIDKVVGILAENRDGIKVNIK